MPPKAARALEKAASLALSLCFLLAASTACRSPAATPAAAVEGSHTTSTVLWRPLGSWSGHGTRQTESFTSDTGALRIKWQTQRLAGSAGSSGSAGTFRVTAHSAISGRPLEQAVDFRGEGSGIGYVSQDPHVFFLVVDSSQLSWTVTVEEGVAAEVPSRR